jgi:hypothetical protein
LPRGFVPEEAGFALDSETDRGDLIRRDLGLGNGLLHHRQRIRPNLHRIMLNPTRLGIMLGEFAVGLGDDRATVVEQEGTIARCPHVEGQDVLRHVR